MRLRTLSTFRTTTPTSVIDRPVRTTKCRSNSPHRKDPPTSNFPHRKNVTERPSAQSSHAFKPCPAHRKDAGARHDHTMHRFRTVHKRPIGGFAGYESGVRRLRVSVGRRLSEQDPRGILTAGGARVVQGPTPKGPRRVGVLK